MLKFLTPDRKGKQEPYSYRSRARLVGKCITNLSQASKDDIVVLGRIHNEFHVEHLRDFGIKYIHDICDNKWPMLEKLWSNTNSTATAITTTCNELKKLIETKTNKPVFVIPDPTEREEEKAKFEPGEVINSVYYGSFGNLKQINWNDYELKNVIVKKVTNDGGHLWHIPWSFEMQGEMVRQSDIVLLPVNNDHEMTQYKGNNRPIDAIRQGRFVITNATIPSWQKLNKFIWCGDIDEGIKWAINNPQEVIKKIEEGQANIRSNYTPDKITKEWERVYNVCNTRNS